ncbi:PPOX class F420-dependent oxidoreductase [Actinomadura vinacea]|uniref:PPOX class F420-dependent oxidoreductase n=1 Tax=Actinomadura vinacea TaxID=115336 RepID=A0ABP5WHV3_9ACTN
MSGTSSPFSDAEREYMLGRGVGRLATLGPDGTPHVRPVVYRFNPADGTIDIGGSKLAATQKFRNVLKNPRATFIVDDVAPQGSEAPRPGRGRGVEVRGHAEVLTGHDRLASHHSDELIRIRPGRVITWNLSAEQCDTRGRDVR